MDRLFGPEQPSCGGCEISGASVKTEIYALWECEVQSQTGLRNYLREKNAALWKTWSLSCLNSKVSGHCSKSSLPVTLWAVPEAEESSGLAEEEQGLYKTDGMCLPFHSGGSHWEPARRPHCAWGSAHRDMWDISTFRTYMFLVMRIDSKWLSIYHVTGSL